MQGNLSESETEEDEEDAVEETKSEKEAPIAYGATLPSAKIIED